MSGFSRRGYPVVSRRSTANLPDHVRIEISGGRQSPFQEPNELARLFSSLFGRLAREPSVHPAHTCPHHGQQQTCASPKGGGRALPVPQGGGHGRQAEGSAPEQSHTSDRGGQRAGVAHGAPHLLNELVHGEHRQRPRRRREHFPQHPLLEGPSSGRGRALVTGVLPECSPVLQRSVPVDELPGHRRIMALDQAARLGSCPHHQPTPATPRPLADQGCLLPAVHPGADASAPQRQRDRHDQEKGLQHSGSVLPAHRAVGAPASRTSSFGPALVSVPCLVGSSTPKRLRTALDRAPSRSDPRRAASTRRA